MKTIKNANGYGAVDFDTAFGFDIKPSTDDFDELGHVNNAVYLRWAQEAAVRHWTTIASPALQSDRLFVVLRHEVDYRDPILPGDGVVVRTWLGKAKGPRFDRYVDIRKPNAARAAASVLSTWVMLDAQSRRPKRVDQEVLEAFNVPG